MRVVVDSVVAIMLACVLGGVLLHQRGQRDEDQAIDQVHRAVERISQEVRLRAATGKTVLNGRGWPITIDPEWFGPAAPRNVILTDDRPWLEVATAEQADLQHPPMRIAVDKRLAAFWYNPGNGVVRARVPSAVSDRRATEIYNTINSVRLSSIFEVTAPVPSLLDETADEPGETLLAEDETAESQGDALVEVPLDADYDFEEYGDLDPTRPPD